MSEHTASAAGELHLTDADKADLIRYTRRTDLRRFIGGLFLIYGVIVTAVGLLDPAADTAKTDGIAINLWTGIVMLVVGALFLIWDRLKPVPEEDIITSVETAEHDAADLDEMAAVDGAPTQR